MAGDGLVEVQDGQVAIRAALSQPAACLAQIGAYLVSQAQGAFRAQKLVGVWSARRLPNIGGIVRDLERGPNIASRRGEVRPVLIDTGRLRGSITYRVKGQVVEWGTNVPYASVHQKGGAAELRITDRVRANLSALWQKAKKSANRDSALPSGVRWKDIGFLFRAKAVHYRRIPARPFIGVTQADQRTIEGIVQGCLSAAASR